MKMWKHNKLSFLLIIGSLLLLLIFQIFWVKNTYEGEKENLREKADLVFEDAIRNIEDSIFNKLFLLEKIFSDSVVMDNSITIVRDDKDDPFFPIIQSSKSKNEINVKVDMRTNFSKKSHDKSFGSISLMMSGDSIQEYSNNFDMLGINGNNIAIIKSKLDELMISSDLPKPYELVSLNEDEIPNEGLYSNSHTDILSKKSYVIFFPNYQKYLFQKILPPLLFSILLFGAMLFSFFIVWQSLEKQRRLTELKNDFISNITHELKTPITTVGVALEALSSFDALQNPQRTEEYLDISKHELQRLSILVDKVLKMSLFEKKEPELKLEIFDMQTLIEDVLRSMKLQFEKISADVNFDFKGSNFSIKGDKIHLTNVVYNLIDNAMKYSEENPQINLMLLQSDNQLQLTIQDKGIGIESDFKNKIFEKFFRVPQGNQHDVKGYGLGLSYVASVIKKHQGEIDVDSQINQGTTFTVSIPMNYE